MKTSESNSNSNSMYRGFSLVETLIYLAILSIIMTAIVPTFYALEQTKARIGRSSIELSDRIFIDSDIRQLIKNQRNILEPRLGESSDVLEIRALNDDGEDGNLVKINLENQRLFLADDHDEPAPLHSDVYTVQNFSVYRKSDSDTFETLEYSFGFGTSSIDIFIHE